RRGAGRHGLVDPLEVARAQRDRERAQVFFEIAAALGPGDRQDVVALRQEPRQRELTGLHALLLRDLLDPMDERKVVVEVLLLKPRMLAAAIVGRKIALILDPSRQ